MRGVSAASIRSGSIVNVSGTTSTNTGRAPFIRIASPVAMNVFATVTTSSPGPTPYAFNARVSASVPFATPQACAAPHDAANSRSKAAHSSPPMNCPLSTTRAIATFTSVRMRAYCALRSTIGTGIRTS